MRAGLPLIVALLLLGCAQKPAVPPALPPAPYVEGSVPTAPICAKPAEMAAFNMAATKVRFYVLARNCHQIDAYNAFITKNRPLLGTYEKSLIGYFTRAKIKGGAQRAKDDYDTNMANAQSQRFGYDSTSECKGAEAYFAQLAAAKNKVELEATTAALAVSQPMKLAYCPS
jgi:hypothetical protein